MRDMVETAFIIPLFMLIFVFSIHSLFFNHDRNVLGAAVYETLAKASGREDMDLEEIEAYFAERVEGRLFYMKEIEQEVEMLNKKVKVNGKEMSLTDPEDYIRGIRKLEKIKEELGELK